jgi:1,4-alpha-glucan branching enzyme
MQVWSRHQGYPGDAAYLEFHKIRWPGGLKLWRVTGPHTDLGDKQPYDVAVAADRVAGHARHFAGLLGDLGGAEAAGGVIVAPFDTELFGHWWFEGVEFIGALYRSLAADHRVRPVTASAHVGRPFRQRRIRLVEGSWGAHGDHTMWMNDGTRWTWERLWPLEERFWAVAPFGLATAWARPVLAAAARQLLLAQSSDWQFVISTGAAGDYAEQRLTRHCADAEALLQALAPDAGTERRATAVALAEQIDRRDQLFPDVLGAVQTVLATR